MKLKKEMNQFEKEQLALLELIKSALFKTTLNIPTDTDWDKIYKLAQMHCIVSILEPVISSEYRVKWSADSCQIMSRFVQLIYEQENLLKLFHTNHIPLVVLKGTSAAMYYPEPFRRTMGDIDILVPEDTYEFANEIMMQSDYKFISDNYRHTKYIKNFIEFEIHKQFSFGETHIVDPFLKNGFKNSREYEVNHSRFPCLPPCENGLVLLSHMMQHINSTGLGLRQIIDWMMFVHNELDDETWNNKFRALAIESNLENLAITVTFMCKKWLGLPNTISWCDDADEELADNLIFLILEDGNFGKNRSLSENIGMHLRKEGLFSYLQSAGLRNWKLAQKYAIFRPFAFLYQIFRYIGKGIVSWVNGKNELEGIKSSRNIDVIMKRLE